MNSQNPETIPCSKPIRLLFKTAILALAGLGVFAAVLLGEPSQAVDDAAVKATIVGRGTLSTTDYESSMILSPDEQTAYVTRYSARSRNPSIYESRLKDGVWSSPVRLPFSTDAMDSNPCLSPDGKQMVFMRKEQHAPARLWVSDREGDRWGTPRKFGLEVEKSMGEKNLEWLPDGTLYLSAFIGEQYDGAIYRSAIEAGAFKAPTVVEQVNTRFDELSLCVAKDGSFMIFSARDRFDSAGEADLYISYFRNNRWTPGRNLGAIVNTAGDEINPRFSPDGRRLFFSRDGDIYEIPVAALTHPSAQSLKVWKRRADLPQGWVWTRNVVIQDTLYVMGGLTGWGKGAEPVTSLVAYSPKNDTWTRKASLPVRDPMAPAVELNGKLVLLQHAPGISSYEYDPEKDIWNPRKGEELTIPRRPTMMAVALKDKTFLASGTWANDQWISTLLRSDETLARWETLNSLPVSYYGSQMIGADRTLYLIGAGSQGKSLYRYDVENDLWQALPSMPTGRIEGRGAEWKGHIVVAGGHSHGGAALTSVEMYDMAKKTWVRLPDLPEPRWGVSVAVCNERLFVVGGCADAVGDNLASASVWEFVGNAE